MQTEAYEDGVGTVSYKYCAYKSDTLNQICIGIKFSDVSYKIFGRL